MFLAKITQQPEGPLPVQTETKKQQMELQSFRISKIDTVFVITKLRNRTRTYLDIR